MDLGDLLFFIVFIIIIVSNVYKQMKKARLKTSGTETPVKKPGWKTTLELVLEEARRQMENQAKQEPAGAPAGRPTGWESIILPGQGPEVNPFEEPTQRDKSAPESIKPEKSVIEQAAEVKAQESGQRPLRFRETRDRAMESKSPELKTMPGKPEPVVAEQDLYGEAMDKKLPPHLSVEALRNAVVWAEILAPPVGLRDM